MLHALNVLAALAATTMPASAYTIPHTMDTLHPTGWIGSVTTLMAMLLAVATALMALSTYRLAKATNDSVKLTEEALSQAERHYRRSLTPYCVVTGNSAQGFQVLPANTNVKVSVMNAGLGPCARMRICVRHKTAWIKGR